MQAFCICEHRQLSSFEFRGYRCVYCWKVHWIWRFGSLSSKCPFVWATMPLHAGPFWETPFLWGHTSGFHVCVRVHHSFPDDLCRIDNCKARFVFRGWRGRRTRYLPTGQDGVGRGRGTVPRVAGTRSEPQLLRQVLRALLPIGLHARTHRYVQDRLANCEYWV